VDGVSHGGIAQQSAAQAACAQSEAPVGELAATLINRYASLVGVLVGEHGGCSTLALHFKRNRAGHGSVAGHYRSSTGGTSLRSKDYSRSRPTDQ
jgi:hypothetical protein